jgi:hypothetical protein
MSLPLVASIARDVTSVTGHLAAVSRHLARTRGAL